jgi:hypothetical protein
MTGVADLPVEHPTTFDFAVNFKNGEGDRARCSHVYITPRGGGSRAASPETGKAPPRAEVQG